MDLLNILRSILRTKNEIKALIGENDNLARYHITIHNLLAKKYNKGFKQGYADRYFELTLEEYYPDGPETLLPYNVDAKYYDSYNTEILTDISRDVLNYKLNIKSEIENYSGEDIGLLFQDYPSYLGGILELIYQYAYSDGQDAADNAYEGDVDVDVPTLTFSNNRFTLSSTQDEAQLIYRLEANGIDRIYTGPVTIADDVDVYYYARIGRSFSNRNTHEHLTWDPNGYTSFVYPVDINQDDKYIILTTSSNFATIEYSIDNREWRTYIGKFIVSDSDNYIRARALKNNEYSKIVEKKIIRDFESIRPENVLCTFSESGDNILVTLSCPTSGADIFYAINNGTNAYYRRYSSPFTVSEPSFIIFCYSELNGVESKNRLVYRYSKNEDTNIPADVQFSDQATSIILYCTTEGASVNYRFGESGSFINSHIARVELTPSTSVKIYAYAEKNGYRSYNTTWYKFNPGNTSNSNKPAKPSMIMSPENVVTITSSFPVKYTMNNTDPIANGINYNNDVGVRITEFSTIRAVAINGQYYSDESVASFSPFTNYNGNQYEGGSGSGSGGSGGSDEPGPGTGGDMNSDYFWVTGITGINAQRSFEYKIGNNGSWMNSNSNSLSSLSSSELYYIKGNVGRITGFTGKAMIGGNIVSLVSGDNINDTPKLEGLFQNCANLVDASKLRIPYTTLNDGHLKRLFYGCTEMVYGPSSFEFNDIPNEALYQTFYNCKNMKNGPSFVINNINPNGCYGTFEGCGKMEICGQFDLTNIGANGMKNCFKDCSSLYGINLKIVSDNTLTPDSAFDSCFSGCISLKYSNSSIYLGLMSLGTGIYKNMFKDCTSLEAFDSLPATTMVASCYYSMFENCTSLSNFGNINGINLADSCMRRMFYGCSSLEYAPELNCTNLFGASQCYSEMFANCVNLHQIKAMFKTIPSAGQYTGNWVLNVAPSGTFIANKEADWISGSNAFGPNAIPVGWNVQKAATLSVITSIELINGLIYIKASSNDEIWYSITEDAPSSDTSIMQLYDPTNPPSLYATSYVNACTKNEDGVFGSVTSILLELKLPGVVISCSNNRVIIYCPYDFKYDYFQYQLYEYQSTTMVQDWKNEDSFNIDKSYTIKARGCINGNFSDVYSADIYFGVNAPVIRFNTNSAGRVWCSISYPNPNLNPVIYYKINDLVVGNPPEGWRRYYESFNVNDYITAESPKVVVMAIAQVTVDGNTVWSSATALQHDKEGSVSLPIPVLRQISGTNNVVLVINDVEYPTWTDTSIDIQYKYDQGGEVRSYTETINMANNTNLFSSQNVYMYARAASGSNTTEWQAFTFYFDNNLVHFDIHNPEIQVVDDPRTSTSKLYITSSDVYANYTTVNYFRIVVTEWTKETHPQTSDYNYEWKQFDYANGFTLHKSIVSCQIYAKTQIKDDWSPGVGGDPNNYYKTWTNPYAITSIPAPTTSYIQNGRLYITNPAGYVTDNCYFYMLDDPTPKWAASGNVDEDKYTIRDKNAPYLVGRYGLKIDDNLGYGILRCWYQYAGLTSDTFDIEYNNPDVVTVLYPPEIGIARNDTLKLYVLTLTNKYNNNVILQFRITNPTWSGGIVDVNKYADWRQCYLYGETLSEYLISGTIEARTYIDDEHISEQISTYDFNNTYVEVLGPPQINVIKENNKAILTVTNKNKKAINQFRITNTVWDGWETNSHKYDSWQASKLYGQEIDSHLVSGTIEAFSIYGDEVSDITTENYVSNNIINSDPPTITVTKNSDGETYTVTITNNAWVSSSAAQYYPRIKYHIINCTWDGEQMSENTFIYQGGGDDWKMDLPYGKTGTFTINEHLLAGTIEAFATDATTHLLTEDCHKTAITSVEWIADDYRENNQ